MGNQFAEVNQALELGVRSDVTDFVTYVVGDVLEHKRNHIQLIYSLFHRLGHQRACLGLFYGVGD